MAADESLLEIDDDNILNGMIKLQGQIRGMLIRNVLRDIQKDYEEIVADIEEDMTVHWPSNSLGLPVLRKKRDKCQEGLQNQNQKKGQRPTKCNQCQAHPGRRGNVSVSRNHSYNSTLSTHSVYCSSSDVVDGTCDYNSEISATTEMQEATRSDNSSHPSPRDVQLLTLESRACEIEEQNLPIVSFAEEKAADSYVSKEVQTEVVTETVNYQTGGTERRNERCVNSAANIPELKCFERNTSQIPKPSGILNEDTKIKDNDQIASELSCSSGRQEVGLIASVSSLSSNGMETEVKNQDLNVSDVTVSTDNTNQAISGVEEHGSQHTNISVALDDPETKSSSGEATRIVEKETEGDLRLSQFDLPEDKDQLMKLKGTVAMELLWVEQAIISRKNYLRLKQQLS